MALKTKYALKRNGEESEDNASFFVKKFICDVCDKDCKRRDNLKRHKLNMHANEKGKVKL